ncbi:hypothetical protein GCK72_016915 [Caenorhabditis remanei]|uniref:Uncharacterized protein n=1 Tax=Caenorhabditis remanei TaxID=31234 RepID=A0A6A5G667_CAERE|nr:hypothetical protein GCK72_016915 [Caenorhabditis remanei]KAF1750366.1 hypothetical protein GCK72_016915 [Caenorhabditis remanei]
MYPFNRTTSIHAENAMPNIEEMEEEDEEMGGGDGRANGKMYSNRNTLVMDSTEVNQAPPGSPVEKTILASILEMSNINDKWVKTFTPSAAAPGTTNKKKSRRESLFECSWR